MRRHILLLSLKSVLLTSTVWSQLAIYGDLYVSRNNQLHIAFDDTYFNGGKIITEIDNIPEGFVSFSPKSNWQQMQENSYVDGAVRIYHQGEFTFPVGSEDNFSPITLELLKNTGFVQTKYIKTPPFSYAEFDNTFVTPTYHYWSWQTNGEVIARIKTYWWEHHRLDRLSFNQINPSDLYLGLFNSSSWEAALGHHSPNPFTSNQPLSVAYGSALLLEPLNLSDYQGLSFTIPTNDEPFIEKLVSQIITPNNDGINDVWKIKGYLFSPKSNIKIYGRNGALLFQHHGEYNNDWEGTEQLNGEKLPQGGYFYMIDLDGNQATDLEGWVLIKYY